MTGIEEEQDVTLESIEAITRGKTKRSKRERIYNPWFFYASVFSIYNRDYFIIKNKGAKAPKSAKNDTIILFQHLVALGMYWKEEKGLDNFFHSTDQIINGCNVGKNTQQVILPFLEEKKLISREWVQKKNKMWFTVHFNQIVRQADRIFNVEPSELKKIKAFFRV